MEQAESMEKKKSIKELTHELKTVNGKLERAKRAYNKTVSRIRSATQKERTHKLIIAGATIAKFIPNLLENEDDDVSRIVASYAMKAEQNKIGGLQKPAQ